MKLLQGLGDATPTNRKTSRKKAVNVINIQHSAADPDWITDNDTLDVERAVYGELGLTGFDLDPMTCEIANRVVQAQRIWTLADNGLERPWDCDYGHINHAGGTTRVAWRHMIDEMRAGRCRRMMWVGFSMNQLNILADPREPGSYPHPMDFSTVVLRKRIPFIRESDVEHPETAKPSQPSQNNYLTGLNIPSKLFEKYWAPHGVVFHGSLAV